VSVHNFGCVVKVTGSYQRKVHGSFEAWSCSKLLYAI